MKTTLTLLVAGSLLAGCASIGGSAGPKAVARLAPTKGNMTDGTVFFEQKGDVVIVSGTVTGLKPNSEHGFHVHEKGDCSSGDGMSAGGHFNPAGKGHGHHGGTETKGITIGSGATDIIGKGLIVHRDPDDYKSQPAGNAGPRLACAVIAKS